MTTFIRTLYTPTVTLLESQTQLHGTRTPFLWRTVASELKIKVELMRKTETPDEF